MYLSIDPAGAFSRNAPFEAPNASHRLVTSGADLEAFVCRSGLIQLSRASRVRYLVDEISDADKVGAGQ